MLLLIRFRYQCASAVFLIAATILLEVVAHGRACLFEEVCTLRCGALTGLLLSGTAGHSAEYHQCFRLLAVPWARLVIERTMMKFVVIGRATF